MEDRNRKVIYPTLWKPTLIKGIPRDYLAFCLIFSFPIVIALGKILYIAPLALIIWCYGALKAKEDPEFFTVFVLKFLKIKRKIGVFKKNEYLP